jgi:hypothetical protein
VRRLVRARAIAAAGHLTIVDRERLLQIQAALDGASGSSTRDLCRACAQIVEVSGAGISLMVGGGSEPLCASNRTAARIEDLQYTLGEGPCFESHARRAPVVEPDLAETADGRWPSFRAGAMAAGAAAVFAFPLRVGAVRLGSLTLHQDRAGPLTATQYTDALATAEVAVHEILVAQAEGDDGRLAGQVAELGAYRAEVHQASGMVSVQLGITVADGLLRLRARAFAEGRPLADVAADVVTRRIRLDR